MKINNTKTSQAGLVRGNDLAKDLKNKKDSGDVLTDSAFGASKVNMSKDALSLQKAKAIAGKETVDEAKVARLQKLIDNGKYRVDADVVADRLVDEHLATGE